MWVMLVPADPVLDPTPEEEPCAVLTPPAVAPEEEGIC